MATATTRTLSTLDSDNIEFVILCFEGPDPYSQAGGLGVRVTHLSETLAKLGFTTHLFFVGDPDLLGLEHRLGGDLVLHRWCQWISKFHPGGVYEAENEKLPDFNESLPRYVKEQVIKPAVRAGKVVVILGEEWHTAEALSRLSEMLLSDGLRSRVVMFWNANNTYSFYRIDWLRLKRAATITTVSRYMKQILWQQGVSPIVIPNGVPKWLLCEDHDKEASQFRRLFDADLLMSKIARWDHTKGWKTAIETMELLKCRGLKAILLLRGGTEPYGEEVIEKARGLGLVIRDAKPSNGSKVGFLATLSEAARPRKCRQHSLPSAPGVSRHFISRV